MLKKKLFSYWPLILILLSWCIISSPYLIKHKIPYPATFQVSFFTPWNSYPQYQIPTKNGALSDVVDQLYPWKHFTIAMLKQGQLPLWNPYSFTGNPHLANSQSAVLSPINSLFFVLPFNDAWSLMILLQPLIAGLGMYLLLRQFKISQAGSCLGSISFMFCGFMVTWMPYGTLGYAIALLPLALYAIEKNTQKVHLPTLLLLPISIAISFFSGHLQTSIYFMLYILAYIIASSWLVWNLPNSRKLKRALPLLIAFLLGLVLAIPQLLPSLQLYQHAGRSQDFSNAGGISWQYLITSIAPDFYGNPVTRNDWFGKYAEWASFIGIIPLLLSLLSLSAKESRKKTLFFITAAIIPLLLSMDTPLQTILLNLKIPVFSTSIPSRIIVLTSFSLAVLAGFGLDTLKQQLQKNQYKKLLPALSVFATIFVLIWGTLLIFKPFPHDKVILAVKNFILPSIIFLVFLISITANKIVNKNVLTKSKINVIAATLAICIILTMFDSLRFAQKWLPFDDMKYVFPDLPVIKAMQTNVGFGRVFGNFGSYIDTYYQLPSIEGYDPLYSHRYGEFIQSAKAGQWTPSIHSLAQLDRQAKFADRVLDLLGVNVIYQRKQDTFTNWTYPVWGDKQRYLQIYADDKFLLFKNTTALPHAKLFYQYEIVNGDKNIINRFYNPKFDYKNTLILEEDPHIAQSKTNGKTTITQYTPNDITITVNSPKPGLLFLSDNNYPTWKAYINSQQTPILRADYTFRAIVVPQGKSKIEFRENIF
jgi:hypothetical protein